MGKKPSKKHIESNILSIADINTEDDFVALTVELNDDKVCQHSGILICYDSELQYFHFDGKNVLLTKELPPQNFYLKVTDVVHEDIIASFLWHCEKLSNEANPIYGWHFDESYYDSKGDYYLKNANADITTCVGFCIKVLTGFEEERYLEINDWDDATLNTLEDIEAGYLEKYKGYLIHISTKYGIDINELFDKDKMKRILPSEMFCTAFFKDIPIRKVSTDSVLANVEGYFKTIAA